MKTVAVSNIVGTALDWAVAKCEESYGRDSSNQFLRDKRIGFTTKYSENWSQGGPIIDREKIGFNWVVSNYLHVMGCWSAHIPQTNGKILYGPTPLIAAMRCYVTSRIGEFIEIPEELFE